MKEKRTGNYVRKWNTQSVKQFIEDNNIQVELMSEYIDMYTKMKFRCSCGNIFYTNWHEFNNKKFPKRQCNECGRKKSKKSDIKRKIRKVITCDYIIKYLKDNGYTCKLVSTIYINCDSKLEFECECGNHFFASWSNIKNMSGLCKECSNKIKNSKISINKSDNKNIKYQNYKKNNNIRQKNSEIKDLTNISFNLMQNKIDEIYGSNTYRLLDINNSYLKIEHKDCGKTFEIRKDHFIYGQGCKFCNKNNRDFGALSNEDFLSRVEQYCNEYEFLTEYTNNHTPIVIRCKKCGNVFSQIPSHIYERGIYCASCNGSKGEQYIEKYLKSNGINYISQYRFKDCVDKKPLPFDFYLPDYNICIEYQGQQHYYPIKIFGGEHRFNEQVKRDNIKRDYCNINNIMLIEITYEEFKDIDKILDSSLLVEEAVM